MGTTDEGIPKKNKSITSILFISITTEGNYR